MDDFLGNYAEIPECSYTELGLSRADVIFSDNSAEDEWETASSSDEDSDSEDSAVGNASSQVSVAGSSPESMEREESEDEEVVNLDRESETMNGHSQDSIGCQSAVGSNDEESSTNSEMSMF